jgi:hypothetical protein
MWANAAQLKKTGLSAQNPVTKVIPVLLQAVGDSDTVRG